MVDTQLPVSLAKFQDSIGVSPPEDETCGMANQPEQDLPSESRGHTYRQWAGSRDKNPLGLRSRQSFFLDIPFYRTYMTVKLTISALLRLRHRVGTIQKKGYYLLEYFLPHIHRTVDAVAWLRPIHFAWP